MVVILHMVSPVNFSGSLYNFVSYSVKKETGRVDFEEVIRLAKEHKPKLIICGGSAYPRFIEFQKFRQVADEVGAFLMADIAHPFGTCGYRITLLTMASLSRSNINNS